MSDATYEGVPPPGGSGSEQPARGRTRDPGLRRDRLTAFSTHDTWFPVDLQERIWLATRGLLADGPELFADLHRDPATYALGGLEGREWPPARETCAVEGKSRVWSNAEAKATEREDGDVDLTVADGIDTNRHYRLTRRAG